MDYLELNELPFDEEMLNALGELEQRMIESYQEFLPCRGNLPKGRDEVREKMQQEYREGIRYAPGRKFLKVINVSDQTTVWGFINLMHDKFKEGDLLKAQGW